MSPDSQNKNTRDAVGEQLRDLSTNAVRFAMMGAGQALALRDRMRRDFKEARKEGFTHVFERFCEDAGQLAGKVAGRATGRSDDGSGPDRPDTDVAEPPEERPRPKVNTKLAASPEPAPEPEPEEAPSGPNTADLPVPNYDELSVASVRARLRNLTAIQVGQLRDYEEAHAKRPEFTKMYDNRIAKLTGQN